MRSRRLGLLGALCGGLVLGACTATPITLPGTQDGGVLPAYDTMDRADAPVAPSLDMGWPDMKGGAVPDSAEAYDGAAAWDAAGDGACLECPLPLPDGGAGDAEAGPPGDAMTDDAMTDDAMTDDAMTDIFVGDLTVRE